MFIHTMIRIVQLRWLSVCSFTKMLVLPEPSVLEHFRFPQNDLDADNNRPDSSAEKEWMEMEERTEYVPTCNLFCIKQTLFGTGTWRTFAARGMDKVGSWRKTFAFVILTPLSVNLNSGTKYPGLWITSFHVKFWQAFHIPDSGIRSTERANLSEVGL
jgi:hypothetical protein